MRETLLDLLLFQYTNWKTEPTRPVKPTKSETAKATEADQAEDNKGSDEDKTGQTEAETVSEDKTDSEDKTGEKDGENQAERAGSDQEQKNNEEKAVQKDAGETVVSKESGDKDLQKDNGDKTAEKDTEDNAVEMSTEKVSSNTVKDNAAVVKETSVDKQTEGKQSNYVDKEGGILGRNVTQSLPELVNTGVAVKTDSYVQGLDNTSMKQRFDNSNRSAPQNEQSRNAMNRPQVAQSPSNPTHPSPVHRGSPSYPMSGVDMAAAIRAPHPTYGQNNLTSAQNIQRCFPPPPVQSQQGRSSVRFDGARDNTLGFPGSEHTQQHPADVFGMMDDSYSQRVSPAQMERMLTPQGKLFANDYNIGQYPGSMPPKDVTTSGYGIGQHQGAMPPKDVTTSGYGIGQHQGAMPPKDVTTSGYGIGQHQGTAPPKDVTTSGYGIEQHQGAIPPPKDMNSQGHQFDGQRIRAPQTSDTDYGMFNPQRGVISPQELQSMLSRGLAPRFDKQQQQQMSPSPPMSHPIYDMVNLQGIRAMAPQAFDPMLIRGPSPSVSQFDNRMTNPQGLRTMSPQGIQSMLLRGMSPQFDQQNISSANPHGTGAMTPQGIQSMLLRGTSPHFDKQPTSSSSSMPPQPDYSVTNPQGMESPLIRGVSPQLPQPDYSMLGPLARAMAPQVTPSMLLRGTAPPPQPSSQPDYNMMNSTNPPKAVTPTMPQVTPSMLRGTAPPQPSQPANNVVKSTNPPKAITPQGNASIPPEEWQQMQMRLDFHGMSLNPKAKATIESSAVGVTQSSANKMSSPVTKQIKLPETRLQSPTSFTAVPLNQQHLINTRVPPPSLPMGAPNMPQTFPTPQGVVQAPPSFLAGEQVVPSGPQTLTEGMQITSVPQSAFVSMSDPAQVAPSYAMNPNANTFQPQSYLGPTPVQPTPAAEAAQPAMKQPTSAAMSSDTQQQTTQPRLEHGDTVIAHLETKTSDSSLPSSSGSEDVNPALVTQVQQITDLCQPGSIFGTVEATPGVTSSRFPMGRRTNPEVENAIPALEKEDDEMPELEEHLSLSSIEPGESAEDKSSRSSTPKAESPRQPASADDYESEIQALIAMGLSKEEPEEQSWKAKPASNSDPAESEASFEPVNSSGDISDVDQKHRDSKLRSSQSGYSALNASPNQNGSSSPSLPADGRLMAPQQFKGGRISRVKGAISSSKSPQR